jgi:hypothetical protein
MGRIGAIGGELFFGDGFLGIGHGASPKGVARGRVGI